MVICLNFQPIVSYLNDDVMITLRILGGGIKYGIFYFCLYLEKIPILTHILEMGWNHQLEYLDPPIEGFEPV